MNPMTTAPDILSHMNSLCKFCKSLLGLGHGLVLALLIALPAQAAIYRTVDAAGNITYTDQPPAGEVAADTRTISEEIEVQAPNTFIDTTPPTPYEPWDPPAEDDVIGYQSLVITAPPDDEAFRDNAGNVVIRSQLTPKLQEGDALHLEMNGTLRAEPADGADVYLTNVPRGTHRIRMVVLGSDGRRKIESDEQVFHLQRISILQRRPGNSSPPAR